MITTRVAVLQQPLFFGVLSVQLAWLTEMCR